MRAVLVCIEGRMEGEGRAGREGGKRGGRRTVWGEERRPLGKAPSVAFVQIDRSLIAAQLRI